MWLEATDAINYVTRLDLSGSMDGEITVNVHTLNTAKDTAEIIVRERGQTDTIVASSSFQTDTEVSFTVSKSIRKWSPDSPVLYDVEINVGHDSIRSYIGFRTLETKKIDGVLRPALNGEFIVSDIRIVVIRLTNISSVPVWYS